uniref:Cathepsin H n=1 Tax=Pipistrellus kuhlii TaxID=59472 RepID=A0A7J7QV66_PIPKU|nr:cathepsin H [Pipistrellus kuhlii]
MRSALPLLLAGAWLLGALSAGAAGLYLGFSAAGPSPPPGPWSPPSPSRPARCSRCRSSSWWTAPRTSTTTAARGASPARPSSTFATTRASWARTLTPTPARTASASSSRRRPSPSSRTWPTSPW